VVVATLGRPERLERLVDTVLADPGTAELVVVVDGPDEQSIGLLRSLAAERPRLRPLPVTHRGQMGALDEGVRHARSEVVVLIDDDVLPGPGTVAGHLAHHRHGHGLVVAGPMPVASSGDGRPAVATRLYAAEYLAHMAVIEAGAVDLLDALWTGNVSLRRADCLAVGLASAAFPVYYHADTDLGFRLAAAGLVGRYDPALVAAHLHSRNDEAFRRDAALQGQGRAALHRAHPGRLGPWSPWLLVADLPSALRVPVAAAGTTRAARPLAAGLMAAGRACARLRLVRAELWAARLARRVMQWHGAVAGPPPRR
jgi:glycosyltransferase involved in cell wall biosynthesis